LFSIVERRSNIDIDIPAIAFHSLVLAILSNSCRRNVTDPEHERPFGKAMLPAGTKAFCLCSESFRGWPHRLKIYVPNIGDISVIRGSPNWAPSIAPLPRRKIRALENF
jgi:hypothetical protein